MGSQQTGMLTSLFTPPIVAIKQPVSTSSNEQESSDNIVYELASSNDQKNIGSPSSNTMSALSAKSQTGFSAAQEQLLLQTQKVPGLKLGLGPNISSMSLLKSANELEMEKRATTKVTGPLDKQWQNFGVPEAGEDDEQIIDLNKPMSLKKMQRIKETVDAQMHKVITEKRGWAYYEKHQPDYAAFQAEVKKVIMTLIGPTVTENTNNGIKIDVVKVDQDNLSRRLEEVEIVYKRVVKNASAQQDALSDLETRSKALRITEERLREQVKHCEGIKTQLSDKFKMLRDDRSVTMGRLDHTDNELLQYRKDIRELHDQISRSVLDSVALANAKSLINENKIAVLREEHMKLFQVVDYEQKIDLRDQAVAIGQLNQFSIEQRKMITTFEQAIVTKMQWNEQNRLQQHEISMITANSNQMISKFREMSEYISTGVKKDIQNQIDETIQAVLGDRKKYLRKLKNFQGEFYEKIGKLKANTFEEGLKEIPVKIHLNSSDEDSDNSEDRIQAMFEKLQKAGRISSGDGIGSLDKNAVADMLKKHDEERLGKLRLKYVERIPIRRQARYREDKDELFVQEKLTKLHVITNKQVQSSSQLGSFGQLMVRSRRGSQSGQSLGSRVSSSKLSVNAGKAKMMHQKTVPLGRPDQWKMQKALEAKKHEVQIIEFDKIEIKEIFMKLKNRYKIKIAKEVSNELEAQNLKHDVQLFKVKKRTIDNAIEAFKKDDDTELTNLQLSALLQVLSLETVTNEKGENIKTDYIPKKRIILTHLIELELKCQQGVDSSDESSEQSRDHAMKLKPPAIGIIQTDLATDRSQMRSKTAILPLSKRRSMEHRSADSSSSKLTDPSVEQQMKSAEAMQELQIGAEVSPQFCSASSSVKISDSQTSQSLEKASNRNINLALNKMERPNSAEKSQSHVSIADLSKTMPKQGKQQAKPIQQVEKIQKTKTARERTHTIILSSYGEESYDYPENTSRDETTSQLNSAVIGSQRIDQNDFIIPDTQEIPDTDTILIKMKDQIDALEVTVGERTTEIRKLDQYVKRLEKAIINELESDFKQIFMKIEYVEADIKDHIHNRLMLVSGKLQKNNTSMTANKDAANAENAAMRKRVKVFGRKVDQRMDDVNKDHDKLTSKYTWLISCNDYFAELAEQMITITELNSCLLRQDERDKNSICLMGTQGSKTLQAKQTEQHLHRLQHQMDEMEQSEAARTGSGTQLQQMMRPKSGMSRVSQNTKALSSKTNQTASKKKKDPSDSQPVMQIDKRCISCSDSPGQLVQMFKLACLSYFPGKVEYKGSTYGKQLLINRQEEFVGELRGILEKSGANPYRDDSNVISMKRIGERMKLRIGTENSSENEGEQETQMNSEVKPIAFSEGFQNPGIQSSYNSPDPSAVGNQAAKDTRFEVMASDSQVLVSVKQSNLRNPSTQQIEGNSHHTPVGGAISPPMMRTQLSPGKDTENGSDEPTSTQSRMQEQQMTSQFTGLQPIEEGTVKLWSMGQTTKGGMKNRKVSFDANNAEKASSIGGHAVRQIHQMQHQLQQTQQQPQPVPVPGQQTTFRFNASHELLAFNQEQIAKIVSNPVAQYHQSGAPIDEKLLQIQKLKEKALMIQLSREVNKPNSFVNSQKNGSKTPLANRMNTGEIFPTKEQIELARDMARRKHQKETKIMIDTREKFTRRFQFDKLSHQMLSGTPTEDQFSGSAHNELASYDSRTIFRNVKRGPVAEREPKNYANLIGNKSPSLPNLTRNFSAAHTRGPNFTSAEEVNLDLLNRAKNSRNQRPISSMNDTSQPFWKTKQRRDGTSMVIVTNQQTNNQKAIDWNQQRESAGTEQIREMLGGTGTGTQSLVNFSQL